VGIFLPEFHIFWLIVVGLSGLALGSFAGALAWRLPRNIKITGRRRSACTDCEQTLRAADLIPVFSWLYNRGKCRHCGKAVSSDYIVIEVFTLALAVSFFLIFGYQPYTPALILSAPVITAMFFIDWRHMIIPDVLNLALGGLGILALILVSFDATGYMVQGIWQQALAGAAIFFVLAYLLTWGMSALLKKQAMGGGDIKFFAAAGLWLGPMVLPLFMMLSGGLGVIFGLISRKITGREYFPFGPALIVAFIICLLMKKTVFLTLL